LLVKKLFKANNTEDKKGVVSCSSERVKQRQNERGKNLRYDTGGINLIPLQNRIPTGLKILTEENAVNPGCHSEEEVEEFLEFVRSSTLL